MTEDNPTARAIRAVKAQGLLDFADKLESGAQVVEFTTSDLVDMLRAEAETIQQPPAEAKELDPLPLVNYYHREDRYAGHVLPGGLCTFMPRPEFEQDPARYPWNQR